MNKDVPKELRKFVVGKKLDKVSRKGDMLILTFEDVVLFIYYETLAIGLKNADC